MHFAQYDEQPQLNTMSNFAQYDEQLCPMPWADMNNALC